MFDRFQVESEEINDVDDEKTDENVPSKLRGTGKLSSFAYTCYSCIFQYGFGHRLNPVLSNTQK